VINLRSQALDHRINDEAVRATMTPRDKPVMRDEWTAKDILDGLVLVGLIAVMTAVILVLGG
jgi:hypothetical protein